MNQTQIASQLKVSHNTISNDVKFLKKAAQQFVFDLAKSDLAYYYKRCIEGIEAVETKAWDIVNLSKSDKDRIIGLRLIKDCNVDKYNIFEKGPSIMNLKALSERLDRLEQRNGKSSEIY
jgi:transcriptional antiterminator